MPEYLAPGVYVEEIASGAKPVEGVGTSSGAVAPGVYVEEIAAGAKPIEGVDTSTAGFVGAAAFGPVDTAVGPLTSLAEFERQFGDGAALVYPGARPTPAFLWHAARAFFVEGGQRLWVARVAGTDGEAGPPRADDFARGFSALEAVSDVAMIATPGSTFDDGAELRGDALTIASALIAHAERMHDRIAVIDAPNGQSVDEVRAWRSSFSSSFATLNFPWIKVAGTDGGSELLLPPSGFVAGIYARSDRDRGVHKSPANEALSSAVGLELAINDAQQRLLDQEGINCVREFAERGFRLWGARTLSPDSEWKYVNVRRYLLYVEASISRGLQWAVFEPNRETLSQSVRRTVSDFMLDEWKSGALAGSKIEEAFFVRCDGSTMTQDDIDNGRLIVLLGVAALRPAEFVIIRIAVQTGHCDR